MLKKAIRPAVLAAFLSAHMGLAEAGEVVSPPLEAKPLPVFPAFSPAKPSDPQEATAPVYRDGSRLGRSKLSAGDFIDQANTAVFSPAVPRASEQTPSMLKLQVMLSRSHAAPGVIDGFYGDNVAKALAAFRTMRGLPGTGGLDSQVWSALESLSSSPPLIPYVIQPEDVAGPFTPEMPKDYAEASKLDYLGYRNSAELLAEKFHMDEDVLKQLNPGASLTQPGTTIVVANLGKPASVKVARLVADKTRRQLLGYDASGGLVVAYPATIGSSTMPSPSGVHAVRAVAVNPEYWYRPKVNFQQGNNTQAMRLAPGPNNPVGAVWIGLDKPTYGIHGTPEPSKIDKTNSHGCVRLTNWDVRELVKLVEPGVPVEFLEPEIVTGSIRSQGEGSPSVQINEQVIRVGRNK